MNYTLTKTGKQNGANDYAVRIRGQYIGHLARYKIGNEHWRGSGEYRWTFLPMGTAAYRFGIFGSLCDFDTFKDAKAALALL